MTGILQANLNHACQAQDLFLHSLAERGCGLGIIAEPYRVPPNHPLWAVSRCGRAAITWRTVTNYPPCTPLMAGEGYVAVRWGLIVVISIYLTPALVLAQFRRGLDEIGECIRRYMPSPVLAAGDFNAKSPTWGSPRQDPKGGALEAWAAGLNLCLVNTGATNTCVRPRGGSIVDLTWATPSA